MNTFLKSNTKSFDKKNGYIWNIIWSQTNLDHRARMEMKSEKNTNKNAETHTQHPQNNEEKKRKTKAYNRFSLICKS